LQCTKNKNIFYGNRIERYGGYGKLENLELSISHNIGISLGTNPDNEAPSIFSK